MYNEIVNRNKRSSIQNDTLLAVLDDRVVRTMDEPAVHMNLVRAVTNLALVLLQVEETRKRRIIRKAQLRATHAQNFLHTLAYVELVERGNSRVGLGLNRNYGNGDAVDESRPEEVPEHTALVANDRLGDVEVPVGEQELLNA